MKAFYVKLVRNDKARTAVSRAAVAEVPAANERVWDPILRRWVAPVPPAPVLGLGVIHQLDNWKAP